ncbi:MAG: ABC transporter permease [Alistipes sp.]|nr:ABC transporter permease [Alistipes sp.]
MTSRRLYFGVCVVLPLGCLLFMTTIFGSGQMERIPIGMVDLDGSASSRQIARQVAAIPTFTVSHRYVDEVSARKAVQRKEIYGYLVLPHGFESDLGANRPVKLIYYYHYALLSVGSEVYGAFENFLRPLSVMPLAAEATVLGVSPRTVHAFLMPLQMQRHPLFNPDLDYSVYLSQPFFFVMFQVLILLITVYAVGSEIKFRTAEQWLQRADMQITTAVLAKLLPYTGIFTALGMFANYVFFGWAHLPFSCGFWPLNLTMFLLVIASQAFGLLLFSLFPVLSLTISTVSMVGSLGATLSGVTFPVDSMYRSVYYASFLFPVRHFTEINHNLLYGDYGFAYTWQSVAALLLFPLAALLLLPRLKRAILTHRYEKIEG